MGYKRVLAVFMLSGLCGAVSFGCGNSGEPVFVPDLSSGQWINPANLNDTFAFSFTFTDKERNAAVFDGSEGNGVINASFSGFFLNRDIQLVYDVTGGPKDGQFYAGTFTMSRQMTLTTPDGKLVLNLLAQ